MLHAKVNAESVANIVAVFTTLLTGSCLVLPLARIVGFVSLPVIITRGVRNYLLIMLFVYVMTAPMTNIAENVESAVTSVRCVHTLVALDAQEVYSNVLSHSSLYIFFAQAKNVSNILLNMSGIGDGIKHILHEVHRATLSLGEFIDGATKFFDEANDMCEEILAS